MNEELKRKWDEGDYAMTAPTIVTPGLEFDAETHAYRLDGERLPGVTDILAAGGLVRGAEWFTAESAERGRVMHAAIALENQGCLDEASLHEAIVPYVAAFRRFVRETGYRSIFPEIAMAHRQWRYAGTADDAGALPGGEIVLPDYKSGSFQAAQIVQLALYRELLANNADHLGLRKGEIPERMFILRLTRAGTYQLKSGRDLRPPLGPPAALSLGLAALQTFRFKEAYHGHGNNGRH